MIASVLWIVATAAWADETPENRHPQAGSVSREPSCKAAVSQTASLNEFSGVQIETSDIGLHEQFFVTVLQAPVVQRAGHPQADSLRGYCYRGVLVVVRQDLRTPRPMGWVQINFSVSDVAAIQEEIERAYHASPVFGLSESARSRIIRIRLKPDVMRGDRHAIRLEVSGPEGFMIGFDQYR